MRSIPGADLSCGPTPASAPARGQVDADLHHQWLRIAGRCPPFMFDMAIEHELKK